MKKNKNSSNSKVYEGPEYRPVVIWLTGYSGAGKSSIASSTQEQLIKKNLRVSILDGDILRQSLCKDLGFSQKDRSENLRRAAEIAKTLSRNGNIVICSFISPLKSQRDRARSILLDHFFEVHINTSLETCEKRDVKGLYAKARSEEIKEFTGISSKYEPPHNPDLTISTTEQTIKESSQKLINFILQKI